MKARRVAEAIRTKVPGEQRTTKETNIWVVLDGKKVLRVTCPKGHGAGADVKPGTLRSIRNQLRLGDDQLKDFVECRMSSTEYEKHVRALLAKEQPA